MDFYVRSVYVYCTLHLNKYAQTYTYILKYIINTCAYCTQKHIYIYIYTYVTVYVYYA
jgi:hypothetical protein